MKHYLLFSILLLSVACCRHKEPTTVKEQHPVEGMAIVELDSISNKKNKYVISEEFFAILPNEREAYFDKINKYYEETMYKEAAADIRTSTLYLDAEISKAPEPEKHELSEDRAKLIAFAERLEKGEQINLEELKKTFYDINITLYRFYVQAHEALDWDYDFDVNTMGIYLGHAMQDLENAEKWSGKKFNVEQKKDIEQGKSLSQRMKESIKKDKAKLKKDWDAFVKKLKNYKFEFYGPMY